MPEIPDLTLYVEGLERVVVGHVLAKVSVFGPSLLKTFDPHLSSVEGKRVLGVRRVGKRLVFELEDDLRLALHLMISGRLRWKRPAAKAGGRAGLATFAFDHGTLVLTEASSRKRAQLHVLRGDAAVRALDAGGIEPLEADVAAFAEALRRENRTLKRAFTDPRIIAGIGNAYSDEILHVAKLSPYKRTRDLDDADIQQLHHATRSVLTEWTDRLREQQKGVFPDKVTAFHDQMRVHGKFGEPCPECGAKVQRIVRAENEVNYCAKCQTGGVVLADRALSKLLGDDWPRTLEELEERTGR